MSENHATFDCVDVVLKKARQSTASDWAVCEALSERASSIAEIKAAMPEFANLVSTAVEKGDEKPFRYCELLWAASIYIKPYYTLPMPGRVFDQQRLLLLNFIVFFHAHSTLPYHSLSQSRGYMQQALLFGSKYGNKYLGNFAVKFDLSTEKGCVDLFSAIRDDVEESFL